MLSSYNVEFNVRGNCTVLVDEALTSVIDNIVRNAIIHDRSDKIDITVSRTNDFCEIRTQITAMEYQMRLKIGCLMKNFYRETGHTGLSLYIVKKVVGRYDGDVFVEDNKLKGSVFVVRLKAK